MLLISNAHIVNPDKTFDADILIREGKIAELAPPGSLTAEPGSKQFEAKDMLVIPGGIDPHVHLALPTPAGPSADDFISGGRAALSGGVTQIIDFVTPARGQALTEALAQRKKEAEGCAVGLDFHMGISGWLPDMEKQMEICVKEHGIKSFKTYLAYRQNIGIGYEELEKIMYMAARLDAIVLVHAEEDEPIEALRSSFSQKGLGYPKYHALSRPPETESHAVEKVIEMVRKIHCKTYLVHISTAQSAQLIARAKQQGLPLYAETCPQYLLFDDQVYEGTFEQTAPYVFSPPARPACHKEALWDHLQQGTFDTVATDHCPFHMHQKKMGKDDFTRIPNGAGGLEFRIPLLFHFGVQEKKLSLQQWVQLSSSHAANIFGYASKGTIARDKDADLTFFSPQQTQTLSTTTHTQNCDINIFERMHIKGKIIQVLRNGKFAHNGNKQPVF